MLNFGFIGFGQVGGIFADNAKSLGYKALAFNTAKVDLQGLSELDSEEKTHLAGFEGAGKDRGIGEEAFLEHQDLIRGGIEEQFKHAHVLFPVFAIGGGTGSGMAGNVVRMLTDTFQTKVVSPILFLPDEEESLRAKMNALEAFTDISSIEEIGTTFMIDNQQVMNLYESHPLHEKYERSRIDFLTGLHAFNQTTDKKSPISNLDSMDLLTVLSERGQGMITEAPLSKEEAKDPEQLAKRMNHASSFGIHAKNNLQHISKSATLYNIPTAWTASLKPEAYLHNLGLPLETFTGIYESERSDIAALFTGLPFPSSILKRYEETIKENEKQVISSLNHVRSQTYDAKQNWTKDLKRKRRIKM
ncbi:hypothetical protein IMZ31_20815 (plasmid) [Pontibacillus sp. ALD_SL1]|uniref:tubulin-like doman-containing protein n=1 Tax=Pontibacillus sp. ALD_SL1 TaxID=2777185 RepID=UPI001A97C326|nr:tubulin-like doman-containing protein [Pontibacillus sp. ALD_SL1]QST02992.1 hypothetical protein IMZ31_20815 [Pontibacillus sp. ALD_SL1]